MGTILVVMGNRLWLAYQDWAGFGWLNKTSKVVWSEETKHLLVCWSSMFISSSVQLDDLMQFLF